MRILKKEIWPFKVKLNVDDSRMIMHDIEMWLGENLGSFKSSWNAVYHHDYTDFYFKSGEDAMMFQLKWS